MPGHGTSGPAPHSTGHRAWAGQWRQAWPAEPRARLGWTPGQLDSRADQPRVSPSCPEWPARSQSRIPPQSELPSWAGNARLPLMTSGCLPRAASGGGCLLPEAFARSFFCPRTGGGHGEPVFPITALSPGARKGLTPSRDLNRASIGRWCAGLSRSYMGAGGGWAEELLGNHTPLTYTDALFSQAPGHLRVKETSL